MTLAIQNVSEEHKKYGKVERRSRNAEDVFEGVHGGMDPHTVLFRQRRREIQNEGLEPSFIGIGVKIRPCPTGAQVDDLRSRAVRPKNPANCIRAIRSLPWKANRWAACPSTKSFSASRERKDTDVHLTIVKRLDHQTENDHAAPG